MWDQTRNRPFYRAYRESGIGSEIENKSDLAHVPVDGHYRVHDHDHGPSQTSQVAPEDIQRHSLYRSSTGWWNMGPRLGEGHTETAEAPSTYPLDVPRSHKQV